MRTASLQILYEDNHCIAVVKSAGVLTTHYEGKEETLDRAVKAYLKKKHAKPGNVFLGVVQRLDRPVSGVVLFARTSKSAARLAEQFRERTIEKTYWAVVEGNVAEESGTFEDSLLKNENAAKVEVVAATAAGVRQAKLEFRRLQCIDGVALLELRPRTGRKHQLRVQLAHRGHPIYGDKKYGSRLDFGEAIALHARSLTFSHPIRYERVTLVAPLPGTWRERFPRLLPKE